MKLIREVFASLLTLGALLCVRTASATTITYTYTGNNFTLVDRSIPGTVTGAHTITTSDFISGSFTTSVPLAANLHSVSITPYATPYLLSASLSDGAGDTEPSSLSNMILIVSTDATGNITAWRWNVYNTSGTISLSTCSGATMSCATINSGSSSQTSQDMVSISSTLNDVNANNNGFVFDTPGTWSVSGIVATTPEPSSCLLLATGTMTLLGAARRRACASPTRKSRRKK